MGCAADIANKLTPAGWYDICHSIFVNGGAMIVLGLLAWGWLRRRPGWRGLIIGGEIAWASHLVLDATYNHGRGVHVFWPVSDGALVLTLPWFSTIKLPWSDHTAENWRTFGIEAIFYGAILAVCVIIRRWRIRHLRKAS